MIKDIFLAYIALKKKVAKMAIFGPKPWVKAYLQKCQFFDFFKVFVFIPYKGDFCLWNIIKDNFRAYIAKKKIEKMAIFGPKPWVTSRLQKCQFFDFF